VWLGFDLSEYVQHGGNATTDMASVLTGHKLTVGRVAVGPAGAGAKLVCWWPLERWCSCGDGTGGCGEEEGFGSAAGGGGGTTTMSPHKHLPGSCPSTPG
jgi:hypothetical protein